MEQSIIISRVWTELFRIKSWLIQIEIYTDRKRHNSKKVSLLIIISALFCLTSIIIQSIFQFYSQENAPIFSWIIGVSSIIAALATAIKDFMPHIMQPERELCELDGLHEFYSNYFQKLEKGFMLRYNPVSDMNDIKLIQYFDKIASSEGDNKSKMNRLIHGVTSKEKCLIEQRTIKYFESTYKF